jgi:hypothetical protein
MHEILGENVFIDDVMSELVTSYFETDLSSGLVRLAAAHKDAHEIHGEGALLTSCLSL